MRPIRQQNEMYKKALKVAKRIAITILCTIPFLIIFGYATRNIIIYNWAQTLCFMIIMAVTVLIEELVVRAKEKKKAEEAMLETKKDVFK